MELLGNLAGIVAIACWIFVLIKMFGDKEKGGTLHGVIGILTCGIWAFIWGWINSARHQHLRNVMIAWSIAWVVGIFTAPWNAFD